MDFSEVFDRIANLTLQDSLIICLEHDMRYIISISEKETNNDLNPVVFKTPQNAYQNPNTMYSDIVEIITRLGYAENLLEIMPYIDEYLSIYF